MASLCWHFGCCKKKCFFVTAINCKYRLEARDWGRNIDARCSDTADPLQFTEFAVARKKRGKRGVLSHCVAQSVLASQAWYL
uniref:Uncharacterized protein n=1 Tax=Arundo donax TaxID=35708 RepID=A0A0A8ZDQ5_ARUDO